MRKILEDKENKTEAELQFRSKLSPKSYVLKTRLPIGGL